MKNKIKVYLDTNMIHDYFANQATAVRRKEDAVLPSKRLRTLFNFMHLFIAMNLVQKVKKNMIYLSSSNFSIFTQEYLKHSGGFASG